ncbi:hypothetical protein D9M71_684760 [compost metagenome]
MHLTGGAGFAKQCAQLGPHSVDGDAQARRAVFQGQPLGQQFGQSQFGWAELEKLGQQWAWQAIFQQCQ